MKQEEPLVQPKQKQEVSLQLEVFHQEEVMFGTLPSTPNYFPLLFFIG